jgi:hypothetical protein
VPQDDAAAAARQRKDCEAAWMAQVPSIHKVLRSHDGSRGGGEEEEPTMSKSRRQAGAQLGAEVRDSGPVAARCRGSRPACGAGPPVGASVYERWMGGDVLRCRIL